MAFPNEPGRVLAPTIATDRASNSGRSFACASAAGTTTRSAYAARWRQPVVRCPPLPSRESASRSYCGGGALLAGVTYIAGCDARIVSWRLSTGGLERGACVAGARRSGVVYGLIAAVGWGASAIAATNAARRAGTYIAVLSSQGTGVVVLVLLAVFLHPPLGAISAPAALGLVGAGLLGLAGYLTFYRALEYGGAVGMVSAISATYGGITTLLAVIVLGENLSGFGSAGVVLAVAGVGLASAGSPGTTEAPPI